MRVGESNVQFRLDSQAGEPGQIPTLAGATCNLIVRLQQRPNPGCAPSRVVVPASRLALNADGHTFVYTALADDFPQAGVYEIQISATLADGVSVRLSNVGTIIIDASL